jgi:hypothetical protein
MLPALVFPNLIDGISTNGALRNSVRSENRRARALTFSVIDIKSKFDVSYGIKVHMMGEPTYSGYSRVVAPGMS